MIQHGYIVLLLMQPISSLQEAGFIQRYGQGNFTLLLCQFQPSGLRAALSVRPTLRCVCNYLRNNRLLV